MLIPYYELAAVAGVGRPGHPVTLDDLHKAAWSIYTGTGEHVIPKGTPRPFIFSADEVPGRDGVFLFKIRSALRFPKAKALELEGNDGDTLNFKFRLQPVKSVDLRAEVANHPGAKSHKRITAPEEEWPALAERRLRSAGLEPLEVALTVERSRRRNAQHRDKIPPVVFCEAECTVADSLSLADLWTRGIAAGKAYGFGMLQIG